MENYFLITKFLIWNKPLGKLRSEFEKHFIQSSPDQLTHSYDHTLDQNEKKKKKKYSIKYKNFKYMN